MAYHNVEWFMKYNALLEEGFRPLILTNDECYDIHPEAVRELVFDKDGIHFKAKFNQQERHITIFKDDINALVKTEG